MTKHEKERKERQRRVDEKFGQLVKKAVKGKRAQSPDRSSAPRGGLEPA